MAKQEKVTNVCLLRERSLWKDGKGRTLMVINRWFTGTGADMRCSHVDMLILDALAIVRRPWKQIATYIEDGKMTYAGECSWLPPVELIQ